MITELTQSILNMTLRCGYQTYLRYVKGKVIPPGVAARKGSSAHKGVNHDYKHLISQGDPAPLDEVKDATRDEFSRLVKDEGVWMKKDDRPEKNNILNTALNESLASVEFYHKAVIPGDKKVVMSEEKLFADIGTGIPLAGTPDVIVDKILRDIKTSGKRWPKNRENEEIQPAFYRILIQENGGGDIPGEFIILTNMKNGPKEAGGVKWNDKLKVCGDTRQANNSPAFIESTKARIKIVSKLIIAGDFLPAYPGAWWCSPDWCGYFSICPYAKGRKYV